MPDATTQKQVLWFDDGKRPNVTDELEKHSDIIVHRFERDAASARPG